MNSQPNYEAALIETIRAGRAVIVAGTGISIAASFDAKTKQSHPQASWSGLLEDGLTWLKDHKLIDDEIADAQLKLLKRSPQTHRFISTAEDVTAGMGGATSQHFADWLKRTIGAIQPHDRSTLEALDAIRQQGNLLATTNYDGLLLSLHSQLAPITWLETDALIGVVRNRDTGKIIFLHGYWRYPESVILDWKSYEKIARDERYREDLSAFWKTNTWVYVGCGVTGLGDPDFGLLLERYGERARQAGHWDYCLVRDNQRDEFQAYFDTNKLNIRAIPYGADNSDLPRYLRSLLPPPVPPAQPVAPGTDSASVDPKTSQQARIRSRYLKEARRDFDGRLNASFHHARFIDLGIQDNLAAIKPAWGYQNPETTQTYDTVADAFVGCDRRLLLLGSPGSGKTIALLHLASLLVHEAEQSPEDPLPFVVNLSKFRLGKSDGTRLWPGFGEGRSASANRNGDPIDTTFEDWFVSEMSAFPGLSRELAREWIRQGRVAALLDGLDEFNDERRAELVRLLNNTFLRNYPDLVVVVCSRVNEYLVLQSTEETRLQLRGCVHLQPLTDAQIAVYLEAAQAQSLLSALPDDPGLRELARTPLTLSMLVLAYGGLAPNDLPKAGSLSESRHNLFESYVARMLQRWERRKRNIPSDDSRSNDIPISKYRYRPNRVQRWLGWLALALSVRMRTSFSVSNFHSILSIGVQPTRQPFNFAAVYFAIGALLSVSLSLSALPFIPLTRHGLLSTAFIIGTLFLVSPLAASGKKKWIGGVVFLWIAVPVVFLFDNSTVARLLSTMLPGNISALPLSVLLPAAVFITILAADGGFDDDFFQFGLWFVIAVSVVVALQLFPVNWQLPFLDRIWWQAAFAALLPAFGFVRILGDTETVIFRIGMFGAGIGIAVFCVVIAWWLPEPNWTTGFVAVGASLLLIVAFLDGSTRLIILLGYSLFVLIGSALLNYPGAVLSAAFFGLLCAIWIAINETRRLSEMWPIKRLEVRGEIAADGVVTLLDHMILSPCVWRIAAIARRFPWRHYRFISFCKEAFLLKQSSQEFEFIHRLLRDYFALRELRPSLKASDEQRRLAAIRFLGYQGEAALDVLTELAEDADPAVCAAALTGLSHISSPIVTRCFELHINHRSPLVRQAIIPGIFTLPLEEGRELLSRLQPLGDGCEVEPLFAYLQSQDPWMYRSAIYQVFNQLGNTARELLKARLRSRNKRTRQEAVGVLAQSVGDVERRLLSADMKWYNSSWIDPAKPITKSRLVQCAVNLGLTEGQVLARYQALADEFGLKIKL